MRCEGAKSYPTAFPEYTKQVPLDPKMDQEQGFKKYDGPTGPFPATWEAHEKRSTKHVAKEQFELANQLKIFPLTDEQFKASTSQL